MYKGMVSDSICVIIRIFVFDLANIINSSVLYYSDSFYYRNQLCTICYIIAGFLSYRFFLWYKSAENKRKNIVILLSALAFSLVAFGAMARVIFYNGMLLAKPAVVSSSSSQLVVSGITFSASPITAHLTEAMRVELSTIFYSADIPLILSFTFVWIATAMLLNHYR